MRRTLSVFTLAMINVAAVSSVRNWSVIAEYGLASVFFFALSALIFFIPVSMVSAELATGWPEEGGIFVWVKKAFGHRSGFLAVWLLWVENVIYYPALLSFIAGTVAYIIHPELINNTVFSLLVIVGVFWITTLLNLLGMKTSGFISSFGVIAGTFIPGALIIALGIIWVVSGRPLEVSLSWNALVPDMSSLSQLVLFAGVLMALGGIEMSAVHAGRVQNPQKNYPKAIFLSAFLILGLYVLGVLAIAMVIPKGEISLVAGSLQAFAVFVKTYGLGFLTPVLAILLAIGAFGTLSTWVAGPSTGLLAAAESGDLPPIFRRLNKRGMPAALLIAQAIIVTIFSFVFLIMPNVSSAYWTLNVLAVELYLLMYILLFAAGIKLKYSHPNTPRAYKVPGGKIGMWIASGVGILGCSLTFLVSLMPPNFYTGSTLFYVLFLSGSVLVFSVAPAVILLFKKESWGES